MKFGNVTDKFLPFGIKLLVPDGDYYYIIWLLLLTNKTKCFLIVNEFN